MRSTRKSSSTRSVRFTGAATISRSTTTSSIATAKKDSRSFRSTSRGVRCSGDLASSSATISRAAANISSRPRSPRAASTVSAPNGATRSGRGRIGGIYSEFYQPFGVGSSGYVMPYFLFRNEDAPVFDSDAEQQLAEYRIKRRNIGFEGGWTPASYWLLYGALERGHDNGSLRVGDPTAFPTGKEDYAMLRGGVSWDSLDDAQFPTRGSHVDLNYSIFRPVLGGDQNGDVARLVADYVPDLGSLTDRYHLLLGTRLMSADRQREVHRVAELPRRLPQSLGLRRALVLRQSGRVRPRGGLPAHRTARLAVLDAVLHRREPRSRRHVARPERRAAQFADLRRQRVHRAQDAARGRCSSATVTARADTTRCI